jgi:serine/threonine-protein kinase
MISIELDTRGHLYYFTAVPPQVEEPGSDTLDWSVLFSAAGLNQDQFQTTPPEWIPLVSFDARAAWTGTLAGEPPVPIRLEAASWKGRPVYFQMVRPWSRPLRERAVPISVALRISRWLLFGLFSFLVLVAAFLARRHYRSQRGDLRGSSRLATFAGVSTLIQWFVSAHHVPTNNEFFNLADAISSGAYRALLIGVLYMALEPYVRRRWPQSLIAWTRLLAGGIRDPLVGGHVLVGTALGLGSLFVVLAAGPWRQGLIVAPNPRSLEGWGVGLGEVLNILTGAALVALTVFFLFFLVRAALRRDWLAGAAVVVLLTVIVITPNRSEWGMSAFILAGVILATGVWVLLRFGVLSLATGFFVFMMIAQFPTTSDLSVWYSRGSLVVLTTVLALSVWAFRAALGGRKMWRDDLLDA